MPRIDPKLAVILAVAVILSTLVVLTIFRVTQPDDIAILRNKFPEVFVRESAQKGIETTFSFGAIVGREMEDLQLRFSVLYEEPPQYDAEWEPEEGTDLETITEHLPVLQALIERVERLGGEAERIEDQMEINGTRYDVVLYDLAQFMAIFNDDRDVSQSISQFAVLKRGPEVRFFKGNTGFFLSQADVVKYLMISHGENKTEYLGAQVAGAPSGVLQYSNVGSDEKFSVIYEVMVDADQLPEIPGGRPERMLLQIVKGYADGILSALVVNGVPMG